MGNVARDNLRAARQKIVNECRRLGIDLTEERVVYGGNTRALMVAARRLVNELTPRVTQELLVVDAPPAGAFNGVNKTFTLSGVVAGRNVRVTWGDTTANLTKVLLLTDANPPATGEFHFDISKPSQIITGDAPAAGDVLVVTFKTR